MENTIISPKKEENTFKLTTKQEHVLEKLKDFANKKSSKVFILNGYAGTGKTTLMKELVMYLISKKMKFTLLASTGRAAKVLANKSNCETKTVHGEIYTFKELSEDIEKLEKQMSDHTNNKSGQLSLNFDLVTADLDDNRIYIIDEASMIADEIDKTTTFARFGNGKLLSDLLKHNPNGKFIFVGDDCQLPPVKQKISPALSSSYFKSNYNLDASEETLTEIIRQNSTNDIISSAAKLRKLKEQNPDIKWVKFPFKGYRNISLYNSHLGLINNYIAQIKDKGYNYATLLCQTNRQCDEITRLIKSSLGLNVNALCPKDLLMVTQNNYVTELMNGDLVEVLAIGNRESRVGLNFIQVQVKELFSSKTYSLLLIEEVLNGNGTNITEIQHRALLIDYAKRMKKNGYNQKSEAFVKGMMSDPYLNALRAVYGYALTCHKSQGGEWEEVFLYIDSKIYGIPRPGLFQWLYTAVTRAKKQLHTIDDWWIA